MVHLLSNTVLDKFDQEMERRRLRFARYANDSNICVRSKRAGERVMESVKRFLMKKLKLRVNEQKSSVARPWERKFFRFSLTNRMKPKRRIAPKAVERFQGAGSETDEPDQRGKHGMNDGGTDPVPPSMARLVREV